MNKKKLINILKPFYSQISTMPELVANGKRLPNYKKVMFPLFEKEQIPLDAWNNIPKWLELNEKNIEEVATEEGETKPLNKAS